MGSEVICLVCQIGPAEPFAAAGLCVSCRHAVGAGFVMPTTDAGGSLVLAETHAIPDGTIGRTLDVYPFAGTSEQRAELLDLAAGPCATHLNVWRRARDLLKALRAAGFAVWLDHSIGAARIDRPRGVPHLMLADFVELGVEVADLLTLEECSEFRVQDYERRQLKKRFGPLWRKAAGAEQHGCDDEPDEGRGGVSPISEEHRENPSLEDVARSLQQGQRQGNT